MPPSTPKYNELMWPTLKAIKALGGSATNREIADRVIEVEGFSEDLQSIMHKDGPHTEIEYRLMWSRTYLKGVGAINNSQRGVWTITDKGRDLTTEQVAAIPAQYKKLLHERRKGKSTEVPGNGVDTSEVDADVDWKDGLLKAVTGMSPSGFEHLAKRLLREAGFIQMRVTGQSGDGGIDGVSVYRLSLVSFPIYFQCKKWKGSVGPKEVRDFRGAMAGRGDRGLLITTATFTAEAKKEANRDGAPPVDLIDGDRLCDLLKDYQMGVRTERREIENVELEPSFFTDA